MKMLSTLTLYVVVISCVGLVAGRTAVASEPVKMSAAERRKSAKVDAKSKFDGGWAKKPSPEEQHNHAYFALFDTEHNQTKTFEAPSWLSSLRDNYIHNFITRDVLPDKEYETRVHFNGLTAKETQVIGERDSETGERSGIKLRQVTDGKNFIQLIYNVDDEIQDCELIREHEHVQKFLHSFKKDVERAKSKLAEAAGYEEEEDSSELDQDEDDEGDEGEMEQYYGSSHPHLSHSPNQQLRNVTFQLVEKELPQELVQWMDMDKLRGQCKESHKLLKQMLHYKDNGSADEKIIAEEHFNRAKRALTMIAPGTKWCGRSHIADKYTAVGGFSRTDKCCRTHDHCKVNIPSFTNKFDYFNFRPFTLSHCRCDRSFRACLKMARTGPANLVGKLFFNVVQTQCFVLKPEKVCRRWSWWGGTCLKYQHKKKAFLKRNLAY